jgi:hypothetical protein
MFLQVVPAQLQANEACLPSSPLAGTALKAEHKYDLRSTKQGKQRRHAATTTTSEEGTGRSMLSVTTELRVSDDCVTLLGRCVHSAKEARSEGPSKSVCSHTTDHVIVAPFLHCLPCVADRPNANQSFLNCTCVCHPMYPTHSLDGLTCIQLTVCIHISMYPTHSLDGLPVAVKSVATKRKDMMAVLKHEAAIYGTFLVIPCFLGGKNCF